MTEQEKISFENKIRNEHEKEVYTWLSWEYEELKLDNDNKQIECYLNYLDGKIEYMMGSREHLTTLATIQGTCSDSIFISQNNDDEEIEDFAEDLIESLLANLAERQ
jgi:hypothetical protein